MSTAFGGIISTLIAVTVVTMLIHTFIGYTASTFLFREGIPQLS